MHSDSIKLMRLFRNKYLDGKDGWTILDIGSQMVEDSIKVSYRDVFGDRFLYEGMDIVIGDNVDIVGYQNINKTYNVVVSGSTMEHIKHPWEWLKSISQYFTDYICIVAPHTCEEHRFPFDTYRYFPDGIRDLFEYAGIQELEIIKGRIDTMGIGKH